MGLMTGEVSAAGPAANRSGLLPARAPSPMVIYWALFAGSAAAFALAYVLGDTAPGVTSFLHFISAVTCGWAWLLSRALFRPLKEFEVWPVALVAILFIAVMTGRGASAAGFADNPAVEMIWQVGSLLSSTVLVLTLLEAIESARLADTPAEKRFRLAFLIGYGGLLFAGVMVVRGALAVSGIIDRESMIQAICAAIAFAGGTAATWYRLRHPLPDEASRKKRRAPAEGEADPAITATLHRLMADQHLYRDPEMKVAGLAERLGQPEYKVSLGITRGLGFANFNQMVNSYRIDDAKRMLADPAYDDQAILVIAMDSGFGSIGPFNRAFKAQVGMTPGAFRTEKKSEREAA
ncbi:MAG: AraC family transcriptional regulator [Pseudomonadota bacterium]